MPTLPIPDLANSTTTSKRQFMFKHPPPFSDNPLTAWNRHCLLVIRFSISLLTEIQLRGRLKSPSLVGRARWARRELPVKDASASARPGVAPYLFRRPLCARGNGVQLGLNQGRVRFAPEQPRDIFMHPSTFQFSTLKKTLA